MAWLVEWLVDRAHAFQAKIADLLDRHGAEATYGIFTLAL